MTYYPFMKQEYTKEATAWNIRSMMEHIDPKVTVSLQLDGSSDTWQVKLARDSATKAISVPYECALTPDRFNETLTLALSELT